MIWGHSPHNVTGNTENNLSNCFSGKRKTILKNDLVFVENCVKTTSDTDRIQNNQLQCRAARGRKRPNSSHGLNLKSTTEFYNILHFKSRDHVKQNTNDKIL